MPPTETISSLAELCQLTVSEPKMAKALNALRSFKVSDWPPDLLFSAIGQARVYWGLSLSQTYLLCSAWDCIPLEPKGGGDGVKKV